MDPGEISIKTWPASFYDNETRQWKYGHLIVTPQFIQFQGEGDNLCYEKTIEHRDVTKIHTSLTVLLYRAIVITTADKNRYWVSSLSDITSSYNVLHYFQHQNLLFCDNNKKSLPSSDGISFSPMGKKLIQSVQDSQNTLNDAAQLLHEQGNQIESAKSTMIDIHNDLDIADRILSGLESWLGKWNIPNAYKKDNIENIQQADLPDELDYEILYTKLQIGKMASQCLGVLRVCVDGLIILTDKQKVVHYFKWNEISVVKILSLCELTVTRYFIGKPDLTYAVVCTNLIPVLRLLDKRLKNKVEYLDDVLKEGGGNRRVMKKTAQRNKQHIKDELMSKKGLECEDSTNMSATDKEMSSRGQLIQVQGQKKIVTDEEVDEISKTLQNIKSVAIATQQELDLQLDNIGKLTVSVDEAQVKVIEKNKRTEKLLRN